LLLKFSSGRLGKLIANAYSQENLVSYRWRGALYAELAPLDDKIIGGEIAGTIFSRSSLFYSLYAAVYYLAGLVFSLSTGLGSS
jgi:hypothetical protein